MGSGEILSHINEFLSSINRYFNPIGKFYIQVQILCRVLVCSVFLDDLFKSSSLECDTKQVGCQQNCINRFAPLNHKKVWELELFTVMLAITVFLGFSLFNEYRYNRIKKEAKRDNWSPEKVRITMSRSYNMRMKEKKGKEFVKSRITTAGYIVMLLFRLSFECLFLWIENQLGKHQSQNTEFWSSFWLKENWLCAVNTPNNAADESLDKMLPQSNRSEIFWTDDYNMACLQQQITVTCWIPFSRMKSFGLIFMYWVLIVTTCLTALELLFELAKLCKPSNSSSRSNNSGDSHQALVTEPAPGHIVMVSPESQTYENKETQPIIYPNIPTVKDDLKAEADFAAAAAADNVVIEKKPLVEA